MTTTKDQTVQLPNATIDSKTKVSGGTDMSAAMEALSHIQSEYPHTVYTIDDNQGTITITEKLNNFRGTPDNNIDTKLKNK